MASLEKIVTSMKEAADFVGAKIVTGDTKVVEKARGDGLYLNTSGLGVIEFEEIKPEKIQPGHRILISDDTGRHGTAIMSTREELSFESKIESDVGELYFLVHALLENKIPAHCLCDLTRGGLATALVELAESRQVSLNIDERLVPVNHTVRGACEFLELDPFYAACEGRMIAIVAPDHATKALYIMKSFENSAQIIGSVREGPASDVIATTLIGTRRTLDRLSGDQLSRIC